MMSFTVDRPSTYEISGDFFASMTGLFPSHQSGANYFVEFLEFENGSFGPPPNVLFRHQLSDDLNGAYTVSFSDISAMRGNVSAQLTNISIP